MLRRIRNLRSQMLGVVVLSVVVAGGSAAAIVVTGRDVKDESLTGADVKDGSLKLADASFGKGLAPQIFGAGDHDYRVPRGVNKILVRMWGGGGAGGSGSVWGAGSGGGEGGYVEALIPVSPGVFVEVHVGAGGAGGPFQHGLPGEMSAVWVPSGAEVTATGGEGGVEPSECPSDGFPGGAGGTGSVEAPAVGILTIEGESGGASGFAEGCNGGSAGPAGGAGGEPGFFGAGGAGGAFQEDVEGYGGSDGSVIITPWLSS